MKRYKIFVLTSLTAMVLSITLVFSKKTPAENAGAAGPGFAVVELFTSEGCSSCPPADELVSRIVKEDKDRPVYVLGFHVDYWNNLGWKDEFSKPEYSARQRNYASVMRSDQVYTPQIIVNGKKEFVGSNEGTLRSSIQSALQTPAADGLMFSMVSFTHDALSLQYQTTGGTDNRALLIAFVQKNAQSKVQSGENGGRTLNHVNIVRYLNTLNLHQQNGTESIKLPAGFNAQGWEVVGFVQNTATGEILSAQKIVVSGV